MPQKDYSNTNRQRKKDSKKNGVNRIYSSKHIRILESQKINSNKKNK